MNGRQALRNYQYNQQIQDYEYKQLYNVMLIFCRKHTASSGF